MPILRNYDLVWDMTTIGFLAKIIKGLMVIEPISGRLIELYTNEPGLQFYTGNFLNGSVIGKQGKRVDRIARFDSKEEVRFKKSKKNVTFTVPSISSDIVNTVEVEFQK